MVHLVSQDLSVAGKRAGLAGERSGLFMEQIRMIKEMRDESRKRLHDAGADYNRTDVKPRYMVWENVAGAFSSNKGEDFRAVLEETAKVADKDAYVPGLEGGKWSPCGCILGNGWSIAWRLHDAQYWGVPQRRKRICLLADFNGDTAGKVLFELQRETTNRDTEQAIVDIGTESRSEVQSVSEGLSGDIAQGGKEGERVTEDTERCANPSSYTLKIRGGVERDSAGKKAGKGPLVQTELSATLGVSQDQTLITVEQHAVCIENHPADSRVKIEENGICQTLSGRMGTGGGNVPMVMESINGEISGTLDSSYYKGCGERQGVEREVVAMTTEMTPKIDEKDKGFSLRSRDYKDPQCVAVCQSVVRRLTPTECERLQGFPTIRKVRFTEMTKDEYIAYNINEGNIVVDAENGKVFATRGPGGVKLDKPRELKGSNLNGYLVVSIRNGETKMQCRVHRIVWIAEHGVIPDGYVIDHINNDKQDNRLCNLQLLTAAENSTKAKTDGLYKIHGESGSAKITDEVHDFIQYVYGNTDLSIRQLSEIFGISKSRVHQIIHDEAWTDIGDWIDSKGKTHKGDSDSPRYKALGNSLGLPFWQWMAYRMVKYLPQNCTMASLFSGIGGFELVFSRAGCKPLWCSEIEEFGIAVTKKHFPDNE